MFNRLFRFYQDWVRDYNWFVIQKGIRDAEMCEVKLHESILPISAVKGCYSHVKEYPVKRPKKPP